MWAVKDFKAHIYIFAKCPGFTPFYLCPFPVQGAVPGQKGRGGPPGGSPAPATRNAAAASAGRPRRFFSVRTPPRRPSE